MTLTTVQKNVAANFVGNGWTAVLSVVVIPVYIKFLGVEAWGIIGIFITLQSLAHLVDLGLSSTLNREMATLSLQRGKAQEMRDLVRTFELIYWVMAAIVGLLVFAVAPLIVQHWVQASQLSPSTIERSIRLMGLALFLQCSYILYAGGLIGLQRQVLLSITNVSIATIRAVGAILILWKISNSLQAFFLWHVVTGLSQTLLTRWFLSRSLPNSLNAAHFQKELLRRTWSFAAGISGITIMSLALTQVDKVILSRLLSLEMFGYYILAGAVATSLYLFTMPVFFAVYPRFTQLVSLGDEKGLKELYHYSCQLMSALIIPVTVIIVFFSREILTLWTGNATTVANTHMLLSILIVGTAVNGLLQLPYALQVAYGWTKLSFYTNLISVLVLAPLIILMARSFGAVGAALTFVSFNAGVSLFAIHCMHARILKGEEWRWYLSDVGLPLSVAIAATLLCRIIVRSDAPRLHLLVSLASVSFFVLGVTVLATPVGRESLINFFRAQQRRALKIW